MVHRLIALFGIISLSWGVCWAGSTFSLSRSSVYMQGDTADWGCYTTDTETNVEWVNKGMGYHLYPWGEEYDSLKVTYQESSVIASNGTLLPEFQQTSRYTLTAIRNDSMQDYTLEINGLQPEDSGVIGCNIEGDSESYQSLTVIGIPSKLVWKDGDSELDGKLTMTDGQQIQLSCLVHFPTVLPDMKILMTKVSVEEDVTSKFKMVPGAVLKWDFGLGTTSMDSEFSATYVSEGLVLDYTHDGSTLTCQGPPYANDVEAKTFLLLDITYSPIIQHCNQFWIDSNDTVSFECFVGGNPEPQITWYNKENNQPYNTGSCVSHERLIHEYTCTFNGPQKDDTKYAIKASNALGETMMRPVGAAGTLLPEFALGIMCIVFQFLLY